MPSAGLFPIVRGGGTIRRFFETAIALPRPTGPFTAAKWLRASGLTSSYFSDVPPLLRFIGLTDDNGPAPLWAIIRDPEHREEALLGALQQAYVAPLGQFGIDVPAMSDLPRISGYIRTHANVSAEDAEEAALTMIRCFDVAVGRESVESAGPEAKPGPRSTAPRASREKSSAAKERVQAGANTRNERIAPPTPQIAVQVNIDPSSTPEQIDAIFQSMAKYLYRQN